MSQWDYTATAPDHTTPAALSNTAPGHSTVTALSSTAPGDTTVAALTSTAPGYTTPATPTTVAPQSIDAGTGLVDTVITLITDAAAQQLGLFGSIAS